MIITAQQLETGHHCVPSGVVNPPVEFQLVNSLRRQEILEEMKRREDGCYRPKQQTTSLGWNRNVYCLQL